MILGFGFGGLVFLFVAVRFRISFLVWFNPRRAWKGGFGLGFFGLVVAFFESSLGLRISLNIEWWQMCGQGDWKSGWESDRESDWESDWEPRWTWKS